MCSKSLISIVLFVYNFVNLHVKDGVEARTHDIVPFRGGWFGDVETEQKEEVIMTPIPNNEEYAEFPNIKRRKLKTREKVIKTAEEEIQPHEVVKKKKKNKRKRKKSVKKKTASRKFIKTTIGERDKDSNLTDSKEMEKRSKPVDIIVHIKMSE